MANIDAKFSELVSINDEAGKVNTIESKGLSGL
jgi:hypothetical protein